MTLQEIYSTVRQHLLTQNARSAKNGNCLYRGPNGTKCAAGALIPDEIYTPSIENKRSSATRSRRCATTCSTCRFTCAATA